jgi:hypothetical protein
MFRLFLTVALLANASTSFAGRGVTVTSGACVVEARIFCGAPTTKLLDSHKQPLPCLMSHVDQLSPQCLALLQPTSVGATGSISQRH